MISWQKKVIENIVFLENIWFYFSGKSKNLNWENECVNFTVVAQKTVEMNSNLLTGICEVSDLQTVRLKLSNSFPTLNRDPIKGTVKKKM